MASLDPTDKRPQTLYRMYSRKGRLLYVGVTAIPERRLRTHSEDKDWWEDVDIIKIEHYPDRVSVEIAEIHAIHNEHPVYNKSFAQDSRRVPYRLKEGFSTATTDVRDTKPDSIVEFLRENGESKTSSIVAAVRGVSKNNASDLLASLVTQGKITLRTEKTAKLYSATKKSQSVPERDPRFKVMETMDKVTIRSVMARFKIGTDNAGALIKRYREMESK